MTSERWVQVKELFHTALDVAEAQRQEYLAERCGTDQELLGVVTSLLRQHQSSGGKPTDNSNADELESHWQLKTVLPQRVAGDTDERLPRSRRFLKPEFSVDAAKSDATISLSAGRSMPPAPPRAPCFGDYDLLAEIAHGGMGVVYKARQISLNRAVALKMILAGQFASEAEVRRFQAEAQAAATLNHRHIVGIYEIGCHDGQHYFTMQYIEGRSLAHRAAEGLWHASNEAAKLVAKVARAVQFAHDRGILHRDLKPANIIIDGEGEPHVADFGLARHIGADSSLTLEGAVLGTPSFMAPEQAAGKTANLGAAADIYGLGAVLYFLLTGRPPFTAASALDTLVQVLEGEVIVPRLINPRIGRDLERICLRCLEKAPERRYPTAAALAEDLERFVRDEPVQARPPGLKPLLRHWMRHQPALVSRLVALAICLATAQATFSFFPSEPPVPWSQHLKIISTLVIWGLLSGVCQWCWAKERWSRRVPYLWVLLDTVCLTIVLWLYESEPASNFREAFIPDNAMPGPLVASFVVLVVLSGLWVRVTLVGLATLLAVLAYSVLILDVYFRYGWPKQLNWDLIFLLFLVLTGGAVAYLVHRVRALSRFYVRPI